MTLGEFHRLAAVRLAAAGIDDPAREARMLAGLALGGEAWRFAAATEMPGRAMALLDRRAAREPMAFLSGRQGFWTLNLAVSAATLIPRADSETLIEAALAEFPERLAVGRMLDLGVGTGALLLAALAEFPRAWGVGVDRSAAAVGLARANARNCGLDGRSAFIVGDWTMPVVGRFDLILANPPYIESASIAGLDADVRDYEPRTALDGGPDGLDAYRAIVPRLPDLLAPSGTAVIELGIDQSGPVGALATTARLTWTLRSDLGGIERAMVLRAAENSFGKRRSAH